MCRICSTAGLETNLRPLSLSLSVSASLSPSLSPSRSPFLSLCISLPLKPWVLDGSKPPAEQTRVIWGTGPRLILAKSTQEKTAHLPWKSWRKGLRLPRIGADSSLLATATFGLHNHFTHWEVGEVMGTQFGSHVCPHPPLLSGFTVHLHLDV